MSNDLLGAPEALRERMRRDGYLFIRGLLDPGRLAGLRAEILDVCRAHGWLDPTRPVDDGVPLGPPRAEGAPEFFPVYDDVQRLETFHRLGHLPAITEVVGALVRPPLLMHPLAICRLLFPKFEQCATPPHQDYPNNQGSADMYAVWIPLGPCPRPLGGIAVLEGSHRFGQLPMRAALGAGLRTVVPSPALEALRWLSGDFAAGDALVFHSLTVHRALANRSDRLRVSVDYRYSSATEPVTDAVLRPHFGRLDWEDIYRGWSSREGCYYWRELPLQVVPFVVPSPSDPLELAEPAPPASALGRLWRRLAGHR